MKAAVREQIEETRVQVKGELIEARARLTEELFEARDRAKDEMKQALGQVKHEAKEAFQEAGQALRDATIGKVENMARRANESLVDTRETVVETIRANPIPAALTGLGLLWLYMNRRRPSGIQVRHARSTRSSVPPEDQSRWQDDGGATLSGRDGSHRDEPSPGYPAQYGSSGDGDYQPQGRGRPSREGGLGETLHHAREAAGHAVDQVQHRVSDAAHQAQSKVSGLAHQAQDKVSGLAHQAQDAAHHAQDRVSGLAHQAADAAAGAVDRVTSTASHLAHDASDRASELGHRASATASDLAHRASAQADHLSHQAHDAYDHLTDEARQQAHRAEQTFQRTLTTNPLALGAVALAVGAVVGLSLPSTRREDELLGETRDQLLHRAQGVAHEAVESVHQYSEQAAEQVKGALGADHRA
ncbi:MAG: hypothetical protein EOO75_09800 [Myxococcales bacterium]|nr:MAG: hypothetical protein EOO75_09800 [Myxococcales bacterium]